MGNMEKRIERLERDQGGKRDNSKWEKHTIQVWYDDKLTGTKTYDSNFTVRIPKKWSKR